ncbi:hypothetical protein O181_074741 [Austropuccinia psidii MF-1]|uniref:Reverse transcriptase domain-containing protein n=1 Tax=Austropuccinia psidii MF-1 TaxID=1389203 RepID=A0A9Q3FDE3_9BASI|nr:hypothetical protein [Austropuccinia psidii MF-1]
MPIGLTNSPASFQNLVNDIFHDLLDVFVMVYLDEIMIFSKSEEEHLTHVSTVLTRLRANNLFAKASKCLYHVTSVEYLGYVALLRASRWTKQKYSKFLMGHLQETSMLFNQSLALPTFTAISSRIIQRKSVHSPVSSRKIPVSPSMKKLSVSFTNSNRLSPLLQSFSTHQCRDQCIQLCLGCCTDSGLSLRKAYIAFDSHKLIPEEHSYELHDKELLGIVWALKRLRAFLLSLFFVF